MCKIKFILLILIASFLFKPVILTAQEDPIIMIVLDCSRSMQGNIHDKNKFQLAKLIITDILENVNGFDYGLITFGKNDSNNPTDIELTVIPYPENNSKILANLNQIQPNGLSPIGESIDFAGSVLKKGLKNFILLLSDGIENGGSNAIQSVKNLLKTGKILKLHTVGFDTTQTKIHLLKNIAEAGNGSYFYFNDYKALLHSFEIPTSFESKDMIYDHKTEMGNISYKSFLESDGGFPAYGSEISIIDEKNDTISRQSHWKGIIENISPGEYNIITKQSDSLQQKKITVYPGLTVYSSFVFQTDVGDISYQNYIQGANDIKAFGTITKFVHSNGEAVYIGNKWEGTITHLPVGIYKAEAYNSGFTLSKDVIVEKGTTTPIRFDFPLSTGQISYQCYLDSAMQKPAYGINFRILRATTEETVYQDEASRYRGITDPIPEGKYIVSGMLLGRAINEEVTVAANTITYYNLIFNIQQVRLLYECYRSPKNEPANGAEISVIDINGTEVGNSVGWRGSFTLPIGNYDINVTYQNIQKNQRISILPSMSSDVQSIKINLYE